MGLTALGFAAPALIGAFGAAYRKAQPRPKEPDYPPIPSLMDPAIWASGTARARRTPASSGQPQGLNWATANQFTPYMPGLIGR